MLPSLHTLVVAGGEARALTGARDDSAALVRLLELGVRRVALKLGRDGCRLVRADGEVTVRRQPLEPVATALGGLAVTRHGAGLALASRREIAELLARLERL